MDSEVIYHLEHPDGTVERHVHAFDRRYFFHDELVHLLARAGFEIVEFYCDFDRKPVGGKVPGEQIVVAGLL